MLWIQTGNLVDHVLLIVGNQALCPLHKILNNLRRFKAVVASFFLDHFLSNYSRNYIEIRPFCILEKLLNLAVDKGETTTPGYHYPLIHPSPRPKRLDF